jgi:hypothetical protein
LFLSIRLLSEFNVMYPGVVHLYTQRDKAYDEQRSNILKIIRDTINIGGVKALITIEQVRAIIRALIKDVTIKLRVLDFKIVF